MKVFKLWAEWDFGQDFVMFSTEQKAYDWLRNNPAFVEFLNSEIEETLEEYREGGYIGVTEFEVL